jgi:hypothetical protein
MPRFAFATLLVLLAGTVTRAADFAIEVSVRVGKDGKAVTAVYPVAEPGKPRGVFTAAVDARITLQWTVRNIDKSATAKDVLLHFFVVREEQQGQAEVPKLTKGVAAEGALSMDFKPQDRTHGEVTFTVPQAGAYLVRIELKDSGAEREPFAALDLLVR